MLSELRFSKRTGRHLSDDKTDIPPRGGIESANRRIDSMTAGPATFAQLNDSAARPRSRYTAARNTRSWSWRSGRLDAQAKDRDFVAYTMTSTSRLNRKLGPPLLYSRSQALQWVRRCTSGSIKTYLLRIQSSICAFAVTRAVAPDGKMTAALMKESSLTIWTVNVHPESVGRITCAATRREIRPSLNTGCRVATTIWQWSILNCV
jgi:hypothetical protein